MFLKKPQAVQIAGVRQARVAHHCIHDTDTESNSGGRGITKKKSNTFNNIKKETEINLTEHFSGQ